MYNVILENEYGESIDLMNTDDMICINIDGATSATATLNETENANIDGSIINSERIDSRPISLTIRIFKNYGECRTKLYQHAVIKKKVKLSLVNDVRSVYIEGQVKSIDGDPFTEKQQMVIEILCPESFFNEIMALEEEFSNIIKKLHFEFATDFKGIPFGIISDIKQVEIVNVGEADSGLLFTLRALGEIQNPQIINMKTGEYIKLNHTMMPNEIIYISTIDKNKYVKSIYNNVENNIIGNLDLSSTWLNAMVGVNNYTYSADYGEDKLELSVEFQNKYLGI